MTSSKNRVRYLAQANKKISKWNNILVSQNLKIWLTICCFLCSQWAKTTPWKVRRWVFLQKYLFIRARRSFQEPIWRPTPNRLFNKTTSKKDRRERVGSWKRRLTISRRSWKTTWELRAWVRRTSLAFYRPSTCTCNWWVQNALASFTIAATCAVSILTAISISRSRQKANRTTHVVDFLGVLLDKWSQ